MPKVTQLRLAPCLCCAVPTSELRALGFCLVPGMGRQCPFTLQHMFTQESMTAEALGCPAMAQRALWGRLWRSRAWEWRKEGREKGPQGKGGPQRAEMVLATTGRHTPAQRLSTPDGPKGVKNNRAETQGKKNRILDFLSCLLSRNVFWGPLWDPIAPCIPESPLTAGQGKANPYTWLNPVCPPPPVPFSKTKGFLICGK